GWHCCATERLVVVCLTLMLVASPAWALGLKEKGCYGCHLGDEYKDSKADRSLTLEEVRARFRPGYLTHLISKRGADAHLATPHQLPMNQTEALSLVSRIYDPSELGDPRGTESNTVPDNFLSKAKDLGCTQCHGPDGGALFEHLGRFTTTYLESLLKDLNAGQHECEYRGERLSAEAVRIFQHQRYDYGMPKGSPRSGTGFYENIVHKQCGACHGGAKKAKRYLDLRQVWGYLQPDWLTSFLQKPTAVRRSGIHPGDGLRHPVFNLSSAESKTLLNQLRRLGKSVPPLPAKSIKQEHAQAVERLVRGRYGCLGCHSIEGQGGRSAPQLDDVGRRLRPASIRKVLVNAQHYNPSSVMPTWQWKDDVDRLEALVSFLSQMRTPAKNTQYIPWAQLDTAFTTEKATTEGALIYEMHCAQCHGFSGKGDGFNAQFLNVPPMVHSGSVALAKSTDERLLMGLAHGGWVLGKSSLMPGFGGLLTIGELRSVVGHLRRLCQCESPAWSEDDPR
ncbi:MAG: cytochrome c, partial [Bradymonadia bacterium]